MKYLYPIDIVPKSLKKMSRPKLTRYRYDKLGIKRGDVYSHIDDKIHYWLIDEAIRLKCDIGVVVAAIVKDTYHEEMEGNS